MIAMGVMKGRKMRGSVKTTEPTWYAYTEKGNKMFMSEKVAHEYSLQKDAAIFKKMKVWQLRNKK